jgi:HxlR-like helix-turn-helix
MTGYGQFCAVARAHEVIGGRWTLLVVRELLCGSRRFNDIRRGMRIELRGHQTRFILLKPGETAICAHNPGFPEPLVIRARLAELVAWWRGDKSFVEARRDGLVIIGPRHLIQGFPGWFERYMFAAVAQVRGCVKTGRVAGGERGDAGGRAGHSFPLSRAKWRSTG